MELSIMERRNQSSKKELKPTGLPHDYLKLVEDTLAQGLEKGLSELKKIHPTTDLKAGGALYGDEVMLTVTLSHGPGQLAATTVYASANFNPNASQPGLEAILSTCLDSVGSLLEHYLDPSYPERIQQLADRSLSSLEEAPFEWTPMEESKIPVWVKMDKANLVLESLTDEWLKKNDPAYSTSTGEDHVESEEFLNERLEAIKKIKTGGGGPVTH